jgi:ADP-heptose:LPS heptosyltransferase
MNPWVVRAPDHLGDGVMALPTILTLAQKNPLIVISPKWGNELYMSPSIQVQSLSDEHPPYERAFLFKPSFGCAWRFRHYKERIGIGHHNRGRLLTTSIQKRVEHRIDEYARLAQVVGLQPLNRPCWRSENPDLKLEVDVLFVVGTASPKTVLYKRFAELIQQCSHLSCKILGGPGDEKTVKELSKHAPALPCNLSLSEVAQHARGAKWVISLDSGLGHLVTAVRNAENIPEKETIIIYGSTDPALTGPRGTTAVVPKALECWPCYSKNCHIQTPCLDHPPSQIKERLS